MKEAGTGLEEGRKEYVLKGGMERNTHRDQGTVTLVQRQTDGFHNGALLCLEQERKKNSPLML